MQRGRVPTSGADGGEGETRRAEPPALKLIRNNRKKERKKEREEGRNKAERERADQKDRMKDIYIYKERERRRKERSYSPQIELRGCALHLLDE